MPLRVKDYAHIHETDWDHSQHRDSKEFDKVGNVCVMRATEALKVPPDGYSQMHVNQLGDIFRSMMATQRGIRRMLDFEGPIDPQSVDVLLLARVQLEALFSLCLMLEDPKYVTIYVHDHWRKQYVEYLIAREETKLLERYQEFETPELQRLVILGDQFGITRAHIHTVDKEELGMPMPAGLAEEPIHPFPTPGKVIKKITSSPDKKRMLERLHAKYAHLCSFAHALPAANVFKNIFDSRFPDRKFLRDSEVKNRYERAVVSEAYLTSFMSIAQCTAELSVLYPNNIEIIEAACRAWKQLAGASLFTKAVWEIRTQKLLGAIA
jgi:hypothetical protein